MKTFPTKAANAGDFFCKKSGIYNQIALIAQTGLVLLDLKTSMCLPWILSCEICLFL